jgi:hypothetical protein
MLTVHAGRCQVQAPVNKHQPYTAAAASCANVSTGAVCAAVLQGPYPTALACLRQCSQLLGNGCRGRAYGEGLKLGAQHTRQICKCM